jgi:hypothetical protein
MKKPLICPAPGAPNVKIDYLLSTWGLMLVLIGLAAMMYWFLRQIPSYKSVRFGEHMNLPIWLADAIQFTPLALVFLFMLYSLYSNRRMYVRGFDFTVSGSDLHVMLYRPTSGDENSFPIERLSTAQLTNYAYPKTQTHNGEAKREVSVKILDIEGNEYLLRKPLTQAEVLAFKSACVAAGARVQDINTLISFENIFRPLFLLLIVCLPLVSYWFF